MKMRSKLVKGNRVLVIILVSLIIVSTVILTNLLTFSNLETAIVDQLKEKQSIQTEYAANQIENHIRQVKEELTTLSKFPIMDSLDINECSGDMKIVDQSIEGKISSLLRVDKDGNVVECSSPEYSNYIDLNIKNKDYFKIPKETQEPFIAGLVRQGTSQQIVVSAPLFETTEYTPYPNIAGKFEGVLLSIIELNSLYHLYLLPVVAQDRSYFLLVNLESEDTILKSTNIEEYSELKNYFATIMDSNLGSIADFNGHGKTIITSSHLLVGAETWRLIVLTPLKNVGTEVTAVRKRHLFSLGLIITVTIGVFLFMISLYKSKEEIQDQLIKANITLEKFGINIEVEKDKYSQTDISLEPSKLYLIKEDEENHAFELFISSLNRGYAGLGIVRDDPRELKKKYNLTKTSFIWLSKIEVENIATETNVENLFKLISEFVKKSEKSVILIDRLDYIIAENNFDEVLKKIFALKDLAHGHDSIIILSINPDLLEENKLKSIEAETIDLYGKHLRRKVELSDMEMEILNYVNSKNVISKMVSFSHITAKFNITKPTTRVKIKKLQGLGLLSVQQRGRYKSLKITSAGRRIID